jgi:hypothetical protein
MEKKYKVKVNDSYEFEFTKDQITALDTQEISDKHYHLLKENRSFKAEVFAENFLQRQYDIKINSNHYKVAISNELDLLIEEMGLSLGTAQMINDIKAPMPGLIIEVNTQYNDGVVY